MTLPLDTEFKALAEELLDKDEFGRDTAFQVDTFVNDPDARSSTPSTAPHTLTTSAPLDLKRYFRSFTFQEAMSAFEAGDLQIILRAETLPFTLSLTGTRAQVKSEFWRVVAFEDLVAQDDSIIYLVNLRK